MAARQIAITVNAKALQSALKRTNKALSAAFIKQELRVIAEAAKAEAITKTPERFTRNTKAGWQVVSRGSVGWILRNNYKAMKYLENGTKAHGPKRANRLFIPLNKKAYNAGPKGVLRNKKNYKWGVDYVLARRVRGIRAHNILRNLEKTYGNLAELRLDRLIRKSL
jgi:hypothetical protein